MRKIIVILDGLADTPIKALKNKTPLEVANTPTLDYLASKSFCGLMYPIKGIAPESGSSIFNLLGYPLNKYPGRGPIEALGADIKLPKPFLALRVNFAKIQNNKLLNIRTQPPSPQQLRQINSIDKKIKLYPTKDHRGVLIINKKLSKEISNTHPGYKRYKNYSKARPGIYNKEQPLSGNKQTKKELQNFLKKAKAILKNKTLLLRGAGNSLPKLKNLKNWAIISDMPIEKGIGKLTGMKVVKHSLVQNLLTAKKNVIVQIKGPDTYGHKGDHVGKIKAIEALDTKLKPLKKLQKAILCITSDHATPCNLKSHSAHPVPFLIYNKPPNNIKKFSEKACKKGKTIQGKDLMKYLK